MPTRELTVKKREPNRFIKQLKNGHWQLSHPYEPSRTFSRYCHAKRRLDGLISGEATPRTRRRFTEAEDILIARLWRNKTNSREHVVSLFKGRRYDTIAARARFLNLARVAEREASLWKPEEIEILVRHMDDRLLLKRLLPGRSADAIYNKIDALGLLDSMKTWTVEENRLIETIFKARQKLLKTRSKSALRDRLHSIVRREGNREQILARVREAIPAHLPVEIRDDVHNSVLVAVLENTKLMIDLPDTVKSIITKTYGPRTYSLDAPVFDGSGTNWIDTIESERPHF